MRASLVLAFAFVLVFASCGGSSAPEPATPEPAPAEPEAAEPAAPEPAPAEPAEPESGAAEAPAEGAGAEAVEQQAARGAELYGTHCAGCHGDAGQGGKKAPALVGKSALPLDPRRKSKRKVQFKTALDVFTWVKANMPPKKAGSLSDDEYVAILAFDLKANGVALEQPLDGALAATLELH